MGEIPLTNVLLSGLLNQTVLPGFRFHDVFVSFLPSNKWGAVHFRRITAACFWYKGQKKAADVSHF